MSGKSAHGKTRKVPYYEHALASKHQAALKTKVRQCDPYRIRAEIVEPLVWQEVKRFLSNEDVTRNLLALAEQMRPEDKGRSEEERVGKKVEALKNQMEALAERIARLPKDVDEGVFLDQMRKLQDSKKLAQETLIQLRSQPQLDDVIAYNDFVAFTATFREVLSSADNAPEIQAKIIRKLVHKIEITKEGLEIRFYVGKEKIRKELGNHDIARLPGMAAAAALTLNSHLNPIANAEDPAAGTTAAASDDNKSRPLPKIPAGSLALPKFLKEKSSKRLTDGGGGGSLTPVPEL